MELDPATALAQDVVAFNLTGKLLLDADEDVADAGAEL